MSDDEGALLERVEELKKELDESPNNVKLLFEQGQAYFRLEEFETSVNVFQKGLQVAGASTLPEDKELVKKLELWVRKCNANLSEDKQVHIDVKPEAALAQAQPPTPAPAPVAPARAPPEDQSMPKIRFEWFQSLTHVTVTFFCKDRTEKDVDVEYGANSLTVSIKLGDGKEYQHSFSPLYSEVVVAESSHSVGKYKLEIRLKKAKDIQWRAVDRPAGEAPAPEVTASSAAAPARPAYPSSRPVKKDWDKVTADIAAEEANEKEEGDAALNKLFRDIYSRADENTRRAMNKSFVESGGTVLSTNWEEVGAKTVEGTPPKGMEFKKLGE